MKILLITNRFFPHGDATSIVVRNLAEALVSSGCSIKIMALTSEKEDEDVVQWGCCQVHNIYVPTCKQPERLRKELRKKPFSTGWMICRKIASRTYGKMIPKYRKLSMNPKLVAVYKKNMEQELKDQEYDLCIATMIPQEAVYAMLQINGKTKKAMYQLDTYWNNLLFPEKYREDRKQFEKRILQACDFSVVTPIIYETDKVLFPEIIRKIIPAEFPMIKNDLSFEKKEQKERKKHCVFLGTLYPDIRPPEKIITCISEIKDREIVFDFYGDRQDLIRNCPEYENNKERILLHGRISSKEAEFIRNGADVLVNIDNTNLSQVPSKIFEYFSTGKPIINFYFDEKSPALNYFRRYPTCININVNLMDGETVASTICEFLKQQEAKLVSFDLIKTQFKECTPEYVAKQFLEALQIK